MFNNCEVKIYTIETTGGVEFVAEIPALKGCVGSGNSYEEALEELLENKTIYLETLEELGGNINQYIVENLEESAVANKKYMI